MELEGVVHNGVIVPDDADALAEGTRVRIIPEPVEKAKPFGQRFGLCRICRRTWPGNTIITVWGRQDDDGIRRYVRADRLAESSRRCARYCHGLPRQLQRALGDDRMAARGIR